MKTKYLAPLLQNMLSKQERKFIRSLSKKKIRHEHRCFVVEGEKIVTEVLQSGLEIIRIAATSSFIASNEKLLTPVSSLVEEIKRSELEEISSFSNAPEVLAVVNMPNVKADNEIVQHNVSLVLDDIQDPGNMGTIIRIADWFSIKHIFCSAGCADIFNPKTIQASMGSFLRVKVMEKELPQLFSTYSNIPVIGMSLQGENVDTKKFPSSCFIVVGNEGHGISNDVAKCIRQHITIPKFGSAESLNAAVATGIVCAFLRMSS